MREWKREQVILSTFRFKHFIFPAARREEGLSAASLPNASRRACRCTSPSRNDHASKTREDDVTLLCQNESTHQLHGTRPDDANKGAWSTADQQPKMWGLMQNEAPAAPSVPGLI